MTSLRLTLFALSLLVLVVSVPCGRCIAFGSLGGIGHLMDGAGRALPAADILPSDVLVGARA